MLKEKTPDLLALLTTNSVGASPAVSVVPRPPTTAPIHASFSDAADKKKIWAKEAKGLKVLRKEKSSTLHSSPQLKRPKQLGPTKKECSLWIL